MLIEIPINLLFVQFLCKNVLSIKISLNLSYIFIFRYCDHLISPELDSLSVQLMGDLVRFQDRQYFKSPVKAKAKRRYVAGLREIKKFITVKKIVALLIAPGMSRKMKSGVLNKFA